MPQCNSQLNLRTLGAVGCAGVSKRSGLRGMRLPLLPALLWGGLWGPAGPWGWAVGLCWCWGQGQVSPAPGLQTHEMHKPHSGSCPGFVAAGRPQMSNSSV